MVRADPWIRNQPWRVCSAAGGRLHVVLHFRGAKTRPASEFFFSIFFWLHISSSHSDCLYCPMWTVRVVVLLSFFGLSFEFPWLDVALTLLDDDLDFDSSLKLYPIPF